MFRILVITFVASAIGFAGCSKKKEKSYTLSGKMMLDCSTPASGKTYSLVQMHNPIGGSGGFIREFTCDENGNFNVTYSPENGQELAIRENKDDILVGIPCQDNISTGNIYVNAPTVNIVLKLQVNNAYSAGDTLKIANPNLTGAHNAYFRYPGPFQSGILDTLLSVKPEGPCRYNTASYFSPRAYINNNSLPSGNTEVENCNGSLQTQMLVIN